jgi:hypothetical protein
MELLRRGARTEDGEPDSDCRDNGSGRGTGHQQATRRSRRPGVAPGLDASAQVLRRLHLGRRALCKRNRTLLLGESVGKLWRGRDPSLELGTTIRRQRSVRQRRQLGGLLAACFVSWTPSQWHGTPNGSSLLRGRVAVAEMDQSTITSSRTPF